MITMKQFLERPCHYMRYGDGNWLVMRGSKKENCDGHSMGLPGMREEIIRTVCEPKAGIHYALTDFGELRCGREVARYASKSIDWQDGDYLTNAVMDGDANMAGLVPFIEEHQDRLCYVAPYHFSRLPASLKGETHLVTEKNCWRMKAMFKRSLLSDIDKIDVVLFAASFLTCCAIYDLHEAFAGKWMIDVGSSMDPLCGVISRSYHIRE